MTRSGPATADEAVRPVEHGGEPVLEADEAEQVDDHPHDPRRNRQAQTPDAALNGDLGHAGRSSSAMRSPTTKTSDGRGACSPG